VDGLGWLYNDTGFCLGTHVSFIFRGVQRWIVIPNHAPRLPSFFLGGACSSVHLSLLLVSEDANGVITTHMEIVV